MKSLSLIVALSLQILVLIVAIEASVHEYNGKRFISKGNSFVFHGGSEGIYSSRSSLNDEARDSFIRFEKIKFRRPKEFSNFSSRTVHAIVFEVDDRETIGGSAYGGQRAVCCTPDLAKL
ncbi:hypothetical protein Ancab_011919, partial [Ancistrocladus abbreviatus]